MTANELPEWVTTVSVYELPNWGRRNGETIRSWHRAGKIRRREKQRSDGFTTKYEYNTEDIMKVIGNG